MDVTIGPINSEEEAFRRRKLPPPETDEQTIERFANMLRASVFDARLIDLASRKHGRKELADTLDELGDDLNTVASLAAVLYGLGLKHADIPKNPLKKGEESQ